MSAAEPEGISAASPAPGLGVVVIGRDEGERLERALASSREALPRLAYVDSASSDGSAARARALGALVVELDPARPLSAARARNAGVDALLRRHPRLEALQLLDGDSSLEPGWLERGLQELRRRPDAALVCGRLREREAESSVYKALCDVEWDAPPGALTECGGIFLVRAQAFAEVGGFDERFSAGEEPELCMRLRARGWTLWRIDAPMAIHDAGPMGFADWWRRTRRTGRAFAQTARHHGLASGRRGLRPVVSVAAWTLLLPALALGLAPATDGASALLLLGYPALWLRVACATRRAGRGVRASALYAFFLVLGKFAQLEGMVRYALAREGAGADA